jgi:hypothetical protein
MGYYAIIPMILAQIHCNYGKHSFVLAHYQKYLPE